MHIVVGVYRWWPKRLAFRNDYCLWCEGPQRSVRIRTFDVGHVYWIPLLPLGFWKRWYCSVCNHEPHVNRKTRRGFKWAGLFVLLIFSALFWAEPVPPDLVVFAWITRIAGPVGIILLLMHLLRTPKEPSLKEKLSSVPPSTDTVCPFCGTQLLVVSLRGSCPKCGVVRN